MDKLELDYRVARLESRASKISLLLTLFGLACILLAVVALRSGSSREEAYVAAMLTPPMPSPVPSPTSPSLEFETELRKASLLRHEGLITQQDFEQKKGMILQTPLTFDDDVEAMHRAKQLASEGILTGPEYDILKKKILKLEP